jgi:hypothetical protein
MIRGATKGSYFGFGPLILCSNFMEHPLSLRLNNNYNNNVVQRSTFNVNCELTLDTVNVKCTYIHDMIPALVRLSLLTCNIMKCMYNIIIF